MLLIINVILSSAGNFRLVAPSTVFVDLGEDAILPVHLTPETSAVFVKIKWLRGTQLIFHYNYGHEITNHGYENRVELSTQELETGHFSLTLRNVQQSDSGYYTCRVFHKGNFMTAVVHLRIRGKTQVSLAL